MIGTVLRSRKQTLGIAISESALSVTLPSADGARETAREWPLPPLGRADAVWPALHDALAELRTAAPRAYRSLSIALLPPLVQLRHVELPKLRPAELRLVLSRNAVRYFPAVREPYTAQGVALTRSTPAQYLMAAAPVRLIDAVARAVEESGWQLATIVPAHAAWGNAARHLWPALQDGPGEVVVPVNGHVEVLQLHDGHLVGVRRMSRDAHSEWIGSHTLDRPAYTAAAYAAGTSAPELLPERTYALRALERRRGANRLMAGLTATAVLAAAAVLGHARYALHQVEAQRAVLHTQSEKATAAQQNIAALSGPLDALKRVETKSVSWTQVIADLTDIIPSDASLASMHGASDSVAVAGMAKHGGDVFARVDGAHLLTDARPSAPLRREVKGDAAPVDRFEFIARIPDVVPLYSPKKSKRRGR